MLASRLTSYFRAKRAGSARIVRANCDVRTDTDVTMYCIRISSARTVAPSAKATVSCNRIAESVDPRATVTTKSNALSFANVRFPEIRKKAMRHK